MKSRQELKAEAKIAMAEQRGTAILLCLVLVVAVIVSSILDQIVLFATGGMGVLYWLVFWAGLLIIYVMGVNLLGEYIKIFKREKADVGALFTELRVNFLRKLGGSLWMMLFYFLWSLLFIIPGVVKMMSYYFTQNILADCPEVKATDAIKISMKITQGHKMDVFVFILSFIGWFILSALTCGILYVVYVGPYFYSADAGFYLELKNKALANGTITYEELGMVRPDSTEAYSN